MKRARIDLSAIATFENVAEAAVRAARGKRRKPEVALFFNDFETNVSCLSMALREGNAPRGRYSTFTIHDPKRRIIYAPCFKDRVVHHALIRLIGPVLERALVSSTFACRAGMGTLAAVKAAQNAIRRFPWYVKIDIRGYFDSIDQRVMEKLLRRRLKGVGLFDLINRILGSYHTQPGKGLPIGALTSQYFANLYLDGLDRFLLETIGVGAHVRYMDDSIWWCADRELAKVNLRLARTWLAEHRLLELKGPGQINRSARGVTFCGFRILPGTLRLTRRKRRRYALRRKQWEAEYLAGRIDAGRLQAAYAGVHAITAHADGISWRRAQLSRVPPVQV